MTRAQPRWECDVVRCKGRHQNSPQFDDKNMLGNIGEMYATSHKKPFVPSVGGKGLLCNVWAQSPVGFVKPLQRSPTG